MKKENKSSQSNKNFDYENNRRDCPSCGKETLSGMPGGRDALCSNCGYKDPCCYD